METVIKIEVDGNTKKTNIVYIKFDDSEAGKDAIAKHSKILLIITRQSLLYQY